jgi:hypothetical protein
VTSNARQGDARTAAEERSKRVTIVGNDRESMVNERKGEGVGGREKYI